MAAEGASGGTQVAAVCFDYLLSEFLGHLVSECKDTRASREAMYRKLEAAGFDVGRRVTEVLTKDFATIGDTLEVIKFVCRELWTYLFGKVIDQLQTDNRGVYVLHDTNFRWLAHVAGETPKQSREQAVKYCVFPCGLLRGALAALGVNGVVRAEFPPGKDFPHCAFRLRIKS